MAGFYDAAVTGVGGRPFKRGNKSKHLVIVLASRGHISNTHIGNLCFLIVIHPTIICVLSHYF